MKHRQGMQADRAEQLPASEAQTQCPACAARHPSDGALVSIGDRPVVLVNIWNEIIHQALTKARSRWQIPIAVVREDDDQWYRFTREDQVIDHIYYAKADPLIVGIGLPM